MKVKMEMDYDKQIIIENDDDVIELLTMCKNYLFGHPLSTNECLKYQKYVDELQMAIDKLNKTLKICHDKRRIE